MSDLITFESARDRFIRDRLIGDLPRAFKGGRCVYDKRSHGGCAIGCLIPDDIAYDKAWEGRTVDELFDERPEIAERFEYPHFEGWELLQRCHDALTRERDSAYCLADRVKELLECEAPVSPW